MRQFYIDELNPMDVAKLNGYLKTHAEPSSLEGLFWVNLNQDLLDPAQYHCSEDQPFCFAIEVGESWAKFEFLIRSRTNMKSLHTHYASRIQQRFILDYSLHLIEELKLRT